VATRSLAELTNLTLPGNERFVGKAESIQKRAYPINSRFVGNWEVDFRLARYTDK